MSAKPNVLDRSKREHLACLDSVVFHAKENDFVIIKLTDGHTAKGNAPPASLSRGLLYRFLGRWAEGTRGPEFRFDSVVADTPMAKAGVIKYLTDYASNVGTKTAAKLWDRYGEGAVRILREEPGRVSEDGMLSLTAAVQASADLKANAAIERTKIDLFTLFTGRGFHGTAIDKAIKKWSAKAPQVIRRNPFVLLTAGMPGAGFKRCDKLWLDVGRPAGSLKRQMLCGWNALRIDSTGHTWFPIEEFGKAIRDAIPGMNAKVDPVKAIRLGIRANWLRVRRDAGKLWCAEAKKARDEQRIADALRRLMG